MRVVTFDLASVHIGEVARRLRSAVHCVMLRRSDGEVVLGVLALQTGYVSNTHAARKKRILAIGLLPAAPTGIAEDVQIRRPEV
jgi:hypothetical protein